MKLTHQDRKSLVAWCLKEGFSIEYGKLSLCDLRDFRHSAIYDNRRYQVHSDDSRYPWSGIYEDIESAIEKFLELKRKVRRMR
jgi:hypothetical protein